MTKTAAKQDRLWNPEFIELIALSFITSFSFSLIHSLVSSYAVSFGAELTAAGTAVGIYSIAAMVVRPFGGFITDHYNKKKLLFLSTLLLGVSFLGYVFCRSISLLILLRIIHGVAFGINSTVNLALAVEYIPRSRTGEGLGYYGVGQVISQIIGPPIGVAIKDATSYPALFIGSSVLVFAGALLFFFIFPNTADPERKGPGILGGGTVTDFLKSLVAKECIFYAVIGGLFSMSNGIVHSLLILLGDAKHINNISLFLTVNAIVLFVLRLTVGKVLDRTNLLLVVTISLVTGAVSMGLLGVAGALPLVLAAGAIKAFGNVGGQISLQSACVKKVDAARVGVASSTYYIGADIGNGIGPILGGRVAESAGYASAFFTMAGIFLAGAVVFIIYELKHRTAE